MNFVKIALFAASLAALALACQTEKKCKYKPEAVFAKDLPGVLQYNFEVQGTESLESIFFQNQVLLELHQEVCDKTRQEYKFTVKGDYSAFADSLWMREAVRQLTWLSTLSERQAALREWAGILEANRPAMKLAEDRQIQPGIFVKVDKVISPEQSVLLVSFEQR